MTKTRTLHAVLATLGIAGLTAQASAQIVPQSLFSSQTNSTDATTTSLPTQALTAPVGTPTVTTAPSQAPAQPTTPAPIVVAPAAAPVKVFGGQLFGGMFRATLNPGFNPEYQVAIGDRLQLRLWGGVTFDGSVLVDAKGNIFVPNVGPVAVAGVSNGELSAIVEAGVHKVFKAATGVYAALDVSQPVKIFVTGFVRQPGLYSGVASDSVVSYLDKAGGVDPERGSYIDVVVKRGSQVRKHINLYSFLLDGNLDLVQFQDGDVIVVGPRIHTFTIGGDVFNAYDFEFSEEILPLRRALSMAKVRPDANHVSVVRGGNGGERRSEYYAISDIDAVSVNDGDTVTAYSDRYPATIQVRIDGAHSGEHAMVLPYGATLQDVLARITPNAMSRLDSIYLVRRSVLDRQKEMLATALQKLEEAALSARSKTSEEAALRSKEADLILRFVERARQQVQPKGQVVLSANQRGITYLEDGDVIVIPERTSLVMVHGEVLFPTAVSWQKGQSIANYLNQAGGLTQGADTSKLVLLRQDGSATLADNSTVLDAGDQVMVLPKIETKTVEVTRALTQILYQIAFTARVAFGL